MEGTYSIPLVLVSYVVACAASYTALDVVRRLTSRGQQNSIRWIATGALTMGVGIWTMHFVGMLAYSMPMPVEYDVSITFISLLVGLAAATLAIVIASRYQMSIRVVFSSGIIMGLGICGMHYVGMAGMQMAAEVSYDPLLFALSVIIAISAASAAIWIMSRLSSYAGENIALLRLSAVLVMGVAVCGMHYVGMAAVEYVPIPHSMDIEASDNTWLAVSLGVASLVLVGMTQITLYFDSRLATEVARGDRAINEALMLSRIVEEGSIEFYVMDSETLRFVKTNRGVRESTGYLDEELQILTLLDLQIDITREDLDKKIAQLSSGQAQYLLYDTFHMRSDGTFYDASVFLQLSMVEQPPLLMACVRDTTGYKKLERALQQSRKMESVGNLAAGIAHELNTPAQFVSDNTHFLKTSFADLLTLNDQYEKLFQAVNDELVTAELLGETQRQIDAADPTYLEQEIPLAIDQSIEGLNRITSIVSAMKVFSHPGGKDLDLADINDTIRNSMIVSSGEWKYAANIETQFDEQLPAIACYRQELGQAFLNLIVNAAHAIDDGASNDVDNAQEGLIRIRTRQTADDVIVTIADNGAGMPDEVKDKIFDPFFTTKAVGKGTGQGLTMVYSTIVEQHGGALTVESVLGQGTTFTMNIPKRTEIEAVAA